MRERKLIWFRGESSVERSTKRILEAAGIPSGLFEKLVNWGRLGGIVELQQLLHRYGQDHRLLVFPLAFLAWLRELDDTRSLRHLADVTAIDFHDLATRRIHQLHIEPHAQLARAARCTSSGNLLG